jgi:nucleotide-binding universal stress UspA family protein
MYHVLVPVDKNRERSVNQAEYLTSRPLDLDAARATVLHVYPQENPPDSDSDGFEAVESAVAAADRLEEAGLAVERLVRTGGVTDQVLAVARERDADEILVGGRERPGTAMGLVGSTSKDILQSTDRPVVVTT